MGHGAFGWGRNAQGGIFDSQVPKCEGPGAPDFLLRFRHD
jgi:hypothetical protein